MKHSMTDGATFFAHIDGKTIPVVSSDICRLIEARLHAVTQAMNTAWDIIGWVDWKTQTPHWRVAARYWQENTFVQNELPLQFVSPMPTRLVSPKPTTLPDALDYIARLETALHQAGKLLTAAEKTETDLIAKIIHLESNETHRITATFGTN